MISPSLSPTPTIADTLSVVDAVLGSMIRRLPPHVSRDDLASAGKVALVQALLSFEGTAEEARAYCYVRVRGAVLDELRRLDPLSRQARARVKQVNAAVRILERDLGRAPFDPEVAAATGLSVDQLRELGRLAEAARVCSVDEPGPDGSAARELADDSAACPARSAEHGEVSDSVQQALERLTPIQARVLRRYFVDDATLEEIAEEIGVSKERVRQIREAAAQRLREDFEVLSLWQSLLSRR